MNNKKITKREFKKILKEKCIDYKSTIKISTQLVNEYDISMQMFEDLLDLITYYRVKEEIK